MKIYQLIEKDELTASHFELNFVDRKNDFQAIW